jgi:hypothetical protein
MKTIHGYLRMMEHEGLAPVKYSWHYATYSDETSGKKQDKCEAIYNIDPLPVNEWIGKKITLSTSGKIRCVLCGRLTKKSFGGGSCYVCFTTKAQNDMCILKPETCHFHKGTCREPEWGKTHCFKKHTVYFANSSGIKVGITKEDPISNRWVDQGARFAIPVLEVNSRYEAGVIEHYLANFLPDKTSWQKLVVGDPPEFDLVKEKNKYTKHLSSKELLVETGSSKSSPVSYTVSSVDKMTEILYPTPSFPAKVKSLKLTEQDSIQDTLLGIKGQYLLFSSGVINIRSYGGYQFNLTLD